MVTDMLAKGLLILFQIFDFDTMKPHKSSSMIFSRACFIGFVGTIKYFV